jgi:uncharacterized protein YbjT (DUF2867 family)
MHLSWETVLGDGALEQLSLHQTWGGSPKGEEMRVLILGANGQIARSAIDLFLQTTDADLTLYARNASRLPDVASDRVHVVEGDVLDLDTLTRVMPGHDIVYANLSGRLEEQARNIVNAMDGTDIRRLVFISSMGIYDEVPGEHFGSVLDPYRKSAAIIEASDLDYTIVRPAWLNNDDEIDYETTDKGELFKGSVVSRKSVADLVVRLAVNPRLAVRGSLGVSKP